MKGTVDMDVGHKHYNRSTLDVESSNGNDINVTAKNNECDTNEK